MAQTILKIYKVKLRVSLLFFLLATQITFSQELFIGPGAEFHLNENTDFTTSNTVVTVDLLGQFSVDANNTWGSNHEYVDGYITAYGSGDSKLPTGNNGVYAPIMAKHTGDVTGFYSNLPPTSGSNGTNVDAVANVEHWKMKGKAIVTLPWNSSSNITDLVNNNGGKLEAVAIVGLNGGTWDLVSSPQTNTITGDLLNGTAQSDNSLDVDLDNFTELTFGIDHQIALSVEDLYALTGIRILSNPIKTNETNIRFTSEKQHENLTVDIYDSLGKLLKSYKNIPTSNGIQNLSKSGLGSGLYFLRFYHEGKQETVKIILE